jgi:hypothetical protein
MREILIFAQVDSFPITCHAHMLQNGNGMHGSVRGLDKFEFWMAGF